METSKETVADVRASGRLRQAPERRAKALPDPVSALTPEVVMAVLRVLRASNYGVPAAFDRGGWPLIIWQATSAAIDRGAGWRDVFKTMLSCASLDDVQIDERADTVCAMVHGMREQFEKNGCLDDQDEFDSARSVFGTALGAIEKAFPDVTNHWKWLPTVAYTEATLDYLNKELDGKLRPAYVKAGLRDCYFDALSNLGHAPSKEAAVEAYKRMFRDLNQLAARKATKAVAHA